MGCLINFSITDMVTSVLGVSCLRLVRYTRIGSKVMPLANFHRNCWREDKTHALYVFSILSPFNRCINCTCRHNISRDIYFCTNPTHRRLSKMVRRSVENEIEIRADIKTRALLSRVSTDIYADICTFVLFMLVIQCHFPQFADRLGTSVQA